jgi:hypothetical protein
MSNQDQKDTDQENSSQNDGPKKGDSKNPAAPEEIAKEEIGGPKGLEPTRYGDWEKKGLTSDF